MSDKGDYYSILGVGADATQQEIARAYRALMRSHHPDMDSSLGQANGTGQEPAQEAELLRIMQAFSVLRDPERRAAYDRKLNSSAPIIIPVRHGPGRSEPSGPAIRVTPVRWESGPWA
ncbi:MULTISPECIES: J domain-containing protein [unclassified Arthrobacter]|jgi:DnaJ-class molecular chaperone|uniref:J domain-containing protein n=1 Tax=unclassified Arthrobacter TaxID=235627 RepID=UPI001C853C7D|nr:J domain-containing protein [Arthrobacter sp. MAHUQ-56]MBX7442271.1 J domain-containing protein [Arthrobacter sp. MAHUQ-56]